jgi:ABC-type Fe3+/spermidine/putrescine transport system ATPase subunit
MAEVALALRGISKSFGSVKAVDNLSLNIQTGELFTLLGPSGCGKTTTLRMVAGLERPDEGEILLKGRTIVSVSRRVFVPPENRNMGMVFQSYAIWPNMTVFENIAFPLKLRKVNRSSIKERVSKALSLVGLEGLENRLAPHLSGGQQQRVALARALVYEPEILLLDEPLSNLDAKLREQMRLELKMLQRKLGITLVYVTHDQLEALSLSDQVVILNHGRIEQQGVARELYECPRSAFVRDFIGKTVVLRGRTHTVEPATVRVELVCGNGLLIDCPNHQSNSFTIGQNVHLSIRPEDVAIKEIAQNTGGCEIKAVVEAVLFAGDRAECQVRLGDEKILAYLPRNKLLKPGQLVSLGINKEAVHLWPA